MNSRDFLKPKNFKIKAKSIPFESVNHITDLEKKKIYVNFVKLLNSHFKFTLFKKNLYQHFHCHCGFIAHYNLYGFYGEYFETASAYHYNVNNYSAPAHECMGFMNRKSTLSNGEQFYAIYEEMNGSREGLGSFIDTLMSNQNWGGYSDYKDLDDAIKEAIHEYKEIWRDEIRKAVKAYDKFSKDEKVQQLKDEQEEAKQKAKEFETKVKLLEQKLVDEKIVQEEIVISDNFSGGQSNLFDFMAA